ncbi:MAG TPA: putative lipid II flippase FtsW [Candidatus Limnocylindrales bacterium]|nr:putative lipid II flippase FtsW [Candidatus Limnocylindrales bacterium]
MRQDSVVVGSPRLRLGNWLEGWLGRPAGTLARGLQRDRHQPDYLILVSVVALAAIGILMVFSSSGVRAYVQRDDTFAVVGPQLLWASLGMLAMFLTMRIDYRWWRLVSVPLYLAALVLLVLVLVPGLGVVVGGSARWLRIGPLPAVHPAEFAKLALVIYLAHWLARRGTRVSSVVHGTLPFLLLAGPVILLVVKEPDLGTTGVLTLTAFTMFFVAGANLWQFALLVPAGAAAVWLVINRNPYMLSRVTTFVDPWADPLGAGFHTIQGLFALGLGGLIGTGLGQSKQAGGLYLPNPSNDFIFAIIGEEFGLLGGLLVVGLFLVLAYQGIRVALQAPDTFGGLLATGITAWLTLQAFINIAVVVSLIPITGITLPFISAGGSSLIVSFAAVGILLSISREAQPRGTWTDAHPDRGGRHGRAHLPRAGRRPQPARAPRGR